MHNSIVHTENGFQGVPVAVADRAKCSNQSTAMSSGSLLNSRRLTENSLRWPRLQEPGSRKHRSNIDIHTSLAVVAFVLFPLYHSIRSFEVDMLCFRSAMFVRSFTVKISGTRHQPLLHAISTIFVFVRVLSRIGIICKMCCPLSAIHSTVILE